MDEGELITDADCALVENTAPVNYTVILDTENTLTSSALKLPKSLLCKWDEPVAVCQSGNSH